MRLLLFSCAALVAATVASPAFAEEAVIGKPAPAFTLKGVDGANHSLSDYKGKIVVLEWFNPGCPFVKKHYSGQNMQKLQAEVVAKGGAWLTIDSSAEGKQGYLTVETGQDAVRDLGMKSTALLLDPAGTVGREYNAHTTPHMFVIDANGVLAYEGAIDDKPSTNAEDIAGSKNYVREAVDALASGKKVAPASTDPYGCGVKYPG